MLYVSTRNPKETFAEYRTLCEDYAPDGGLFVPNRLPSFTDGEIQELLSKSFGEIVAKILNMFFPVGLKGWDLDFAIGRHPYKVLSMSHRLFVAELWRNYTADFVQTERSIYAKLCTDETDRSKSTEWAAVAIRIAVLFGVFGELYKSGVRMLDVALASKDFTAAMAVWYARKMGLPVGMIICSCNENENVWDFLHNGVISPGNAPIHTELPKMDVSIPQSLERLIYETLGCDETLKFLSARNSREQYTLDEEQLSMLNTDLVSAVVSQTRRQSLISSIFRTHNYIADPYTAIAFGGLQDYRSRTGDGQDTVILSDQSPAFFAEMIARATGLGEDEIIKRTKNA